MLLSSFFIVEGTDKSKGDSTSIRVEKQMSDNVHECAFSFKSSTINKRWQESKYRG